MQDNETKQWQNIIPKPDSFVVNCGIMLEKMTQGRLRSTIHRVLDHNEERMSAPFFVEPGWNKQLYGKSVLAFQQLNVDVKKLKRKNYGPKRSTADG